MPQRQHVLILWSATPDLTSPVCAWSRYEPRPGFAPAIGIEDAPPYASVLAALSDGWQLLQIAPAVPQGPGLETDTAFLKHECVLTRCQETSHG